MSPTLTKGQIIDISNLDLQALDVMGWDIGSRPQTQSSISIVSSEDGDSGSINKTAQDNDIEWFTNTFSGNTTFNFWQEMYDEKKM